MWAKYLKEHDNEEAREEEGLERRKGDEGEMEGKGEEKEKEELADSSLTVVPWGISDYRIRATD